MTDPNCVHCGARLLEYRGAWFGPGDETTCPAGDRHAPTPVVDDRASIVDFLTAEAVRFDAAQPTAPSTVARDRLRAQAGLARTLAAQIARGDDRLGRAE